MSFPGLGLGLESQAGGAGGRGTGGSQHPLLVSGPAQSGKGRGSAVSSGKPEKRVCASVWAGISQPSPARPGGDGQGRKRGEGERGEARSGMRRETDREREGQASPPPLPNSGTVFLCSRPHRRLSINLSQCKHSKYSLWLLAKTMRAARIKPSFQMSGGNHMKRGRLVYCCVWLGLPPHPLWDLQKQQQESGASNPELHKWACLPTSMSTQDGGVCVSRIPSKAVQSWRKVGLSGPRTLWMDRRAS